MPNTLLELHEKYGPVVRIGPNDLSFQHAAAIDAIYKSGRKLIKSNFYDGFTTFHPNLFGTRDEEVSDQDDVSLASMLILCSFMPNDGGRWRTASHWRLCRKWS